MYDYNCKKCRITIENEIKLLPYFLLIFAKYCDIIWEDSI